MHPAPPDVKAELLGAKRMLFGVPVGSMEREHVCPKSAYVRSLGRRQVIGFEADGTTPNAAAATSVRAQLDAAPPSAAASDAAAGVDDGL